jgi:uncharacterized cupredoxin-like copper-binding protein
MLVWKEPMSVPVPAGQVPCPHVHARPGGRHEAQSERAPRFRPKRLTARAGAVAIVMTNADLKPGGYVCFCTVPHHSKAGMRGRLEVR